MLKFILALSPILVVLVLMLKYRWGGAKAGPVGWLVALVVSIVFFGAGPSLLAYSQMRALMLTLYVLYVIWMALIFYNTVLESGAISVIGRQIVRLTGDRVLQLLMLSWVFSSFLQGVAGYGVPIAVVAPLLIGLGFPGVEAVAAVAIGHGWSVTFGSMAASFNALIAASGMQGSELAQQSALLLGITCFACGAFAVFSCGGFEALRHAVPAIVLIGTVMAGTQYGLAVSGVWNIAAFAAGLAGIGATVLVSRLPMYRVPVGNDQTNGAVMPDRGARANMPAFLSISPYILLVAIVSGAELIGPLSDVLDKVRVQMSFPATETALGWVTKAGSSQSISVFGHAGALLIYASILAFAVLALTRSYKPGALRRIMQHSVGSAVDPSIGIAAMVGFALIMEQRYLFNSPG